MQHTSSKKYWHLVILPMPWSATKKIIQQATHWKFNIVLDKQQWACKKKFPYNETLQGGLSLLLHPGRLTAGTYKSPIFCKENHLNQTSMTMFQPFIFRGVTWLDPQRQLSHQHLDVTIESSASSSRGPSEEPQSGRPSWTRPAMLLYRREVKNSWATFNCHHCWSEGVSTRCKSTWFLWCLCQGDIWVVPTIGGKPPKWMVKIMENPLDKMGWFGGSFPPIFGKQPISTAFQTKNPKQRLK